MLGAHGGHEVDGIAPHVEGEDERDDPLAHGGGVVVVPLAQHAERDGQAQLDEDEEQLHPEGDAQDAVLAVVDPEPLVLPAHEDGRQNVAAAVGGGGCCVSGKRACRGRRRRRRRSVWEARERQT